MTEAELDELETRAVAARVELALIGDVIAAVEADDTIDDDDTWLTVCARLGLEIPTPVMFPRTVNGMAMDRCSYCGVGVISGDADNASNRHVHWHRRLMAANRVALRVADLSRTTTMLLGALLAEGLTAAVAAIAEDVAARADDEEEETHG